MLLSKEFILSGRAEAGKKEALNEGGGFGEQNISLLLAHKNLDPWTASTFCQNSIQFVNLLECDF